MSNTKRAQRAFYRNIGTDSQTVQHIVDEIRDGQVEVLTKYAWWSNGVQYVGSGATTLKQAIAELE